MVYDGKPYYKLDDFGATTIFGNIHMYFSIPSPSPTNHLFFWVGQQARPIKSLESLGPRTEGSTFSELRKEKNTKLQGAVRVEGTKNLRFAKLHCLMQVILMQLRLYHPKKLD